MVPADVKPVPPLLAAIVPVRLAAGNEAAVKAPPTVRPPPIVPLPVMLKFADCALVPFWT